MSTYDRAFLLRLYERMVLIREFEEAVKFLFLEGTMPGTIHQCQGQEASAVGVCAALRADDWITSTFRGHGHALAKGLSPQEMLDELFGARSGCCKGRGGSMHIGNMAKGMVPGIAIVGGGIPLAAGMGLAFKMQRTSQLVACFFGDGAVAEGAFHEGVNMAAIWNLPVIFVCENNLYGASTRVDLVMKNPQISDRAAGYGCRGQTVDGNDVLAVLEATARAAEECRAGKGPVLLELLTYRRTGHSRRDPCHYQPKDERQWWAERDPLERFAEQLQLSEAERAKIATSVQAVLDSAVTHARSAPAPAADELTAFVFTPAQAREDTSVPTDTAGTMTATDSKAAGSSRRLGIAEALREAIGEEMQRDPRVFCIGEDIGIKGGWGGAFTVTLGLEERFGPRLVNTPIAELGFFGIATGAALMGLRPIADVQYGDFLFLASDQIINNAAKMCYMSGGTASVPLVMRAPVGATGRGAQHAQNMERYFAGVPGLKVVAPSNAYDAKGLLKAAVRDGNPVLIFEHKLLYGAKGARAEPGAVDATSEVPLEDYTVPLGRAVVRRPGEGVTVIAWLLMLHYALRSAEETGAEVIDLRSLAPIDWQTIGQSVQRTGRVVIVEEGPVSGGVGAEIAAGIVERWPAVRISRVASPDVPVPFTPVLENAYRPSAAGITRAVRELQ
ncbi:MAG TPA: dehydrogenase E1 component subunit alpha/beta [Steroidobacteraceae bacterium]|nr:dehydrogenase E1 component subunit alpha/beta [Steroidobacteraceae bacterium]